ncbi:MAG TPA: RidA family protein [Aeromonadales bacterium]|nr:RidA family protein [Aeromonadales bacterium]
MNLKLVISVLLLGFLLVLFSGSSFAQKQAEYITNKKARELKFPFSEIVKVDKTWYLSGQLGADPATGKLVSGGIVAETHQTLKNIRATLMRNGLTLDDVVKCTVFIADISQWGQFNKVYRQYFKKHFPARSALGANGLALGATVEVECIAYKN